MLQVENLQARYGRSQVLFDIVVRVGEGEIVTLLGRNGMGKTTTIRSIMGLMPRRAAGASIFDGQADRGRTPEAIARRGIGLVPEGRQVFPLLTVRENLVATAANRLERKNPWTLDRGLSRCFRGWTSGTINMPARCRAASSRCSRSAAR